MCEAASGQDQSYPRGRSSGQITTSRAKPLDNRCTIRADALPHMRTDEWKNLLGIRVAQFERTGMPIDDFAFGLEGPRSGWVFFHVFLGSAGRFACRASSQPNNVLKELVAGVHGLVTLGQGAVVHLHSEPDTFTLKFAPIQPTGVKFELAHKKSFEANDSDAEPIVGVAFADAAQLGASVLQILEDFGKSVSDVGYEKEMLNPFPHAEVLALRRALMR